MAISSPVKRSMTPAPQVEHLTTFFRRIQNGEIRVPAFQRGYVWQDDQIINLLNSVYKGYPIGSLLLWKVDKLNELEFRTVDEQSNFEDLPPLPFPHVNPGSDTRFVLDGIQRLSTLFGVFYAPYVTESLNIAFNLEEKLFTFSRDVDADAPEYVKLADLFVPKKLLEAQSAMAGSANSEVLIDASLELQAAFQEYLLPIVTISSSDIDEVVEIFERVNSSGTRLSRVDFMRALTWSGDFDFNTAVRELRSRFKEVKYDFPAETLIKVVATMLGKEPTPKPMLEMRHSTAVDLHSAVENASKTLYHVIEFLAQECATYSYDFVPYEGQLLVLAKLFHIAPSPNASILEVVKRWFWSTSFSETLRGKPDSYVAQYIRDVERLAKGNLHALTQRLLIRAEDLVERRMIVGKSLSTAIAAMFSLQKAHSITNGIEIPSLEYMSKFSASDYEVIIPPHIIKGLPNYQQNSSARLLANVCVLSAQDRLSLKTTNRSVMDCITASPSLFDEGQTHSILKSQMISHDALALLKDKDYMGFLNTRAATMYEQIRLLTSETQEAN